MESGHSTTCVAQCSQPVNLVCQCLEEINGVHMLKPEGCTWSADSTCDMFVKFVKVETKLKVDAVDKS